MAGILDNKQRMLDTIITENGRAQASTGQVRIVFASFTDRHTFYEGEGDSIARDASDRLMFEASSQPQDYIILEKDSNAIPKSPFVVGDLVIKGTQILSGTSAINLDRISGEGAFDAAESLIVSSSANFTKQMIIANSDPMSDSDDFEISTSEIDFLIGRDTPFTREESIVADLDSDEIDNLYTDFRTSFVPNFEYLPPVNKRRGGNEISMNLVRKETDGTTVSLSGFQKIDNRAQVSVETLEALLINKEKSVVEFTDTSRENNILGQIFEVSPGKIDKLDIVDFGEFINNEGQQTTKHVFFVGKVFPRNGNGALVREDGAPTFVNLFTVIFE